MQHVFEVTVILMLCLKLVSYEQSVIDLISQEENHTSRKTMRTWSLIAVHEGASIKLTSSNPFYAVIFAWW